MRKRIALIVLIALYLVVPAIIKKLPIYEPVPLEKHDTFYRSKIVELKNDLLKKYYEKNKKQITFSIEGEEFDGELESVSDGYATYRGKKGNMSYKYIFKITDKNKFAFVTSKIDRYSEEVVGIEIKDFKNPLETGSEILSKYVSLERYNHITGPTMVYGYGVGHIYEVYINGYLTSDGTWIAFMDNKLVYINTMHSGEFSASESKLQLNDDKLLEVIKKTAKKDYSVDFENESYFVNKDKEYCWIFKTAKGELYMGARIGDGNVAFIYLFPRTAWIISKYVLGIATTLMFTWVIVSEIRAHKRKKAVTPQSEQEETE